MTAYELIRGKAAKRAATPPPRRAERRAFVRWIFKGNAYPATVGKKEIEIRLKDLSRGGGSGLVEEPLAVGDYIVISFDDRHKIEAQVRWTRRVMVGLKFTNLLSAHYVEQLHETAAESFVAGQAVEDWTIYRR